MKLFGRKPARTVSVAAPAGLYVSNGSERLRVVALVADADGYVTALVGVGVALVPASVALGADWDYESVD